MSQVTKFASILYDIGMSYNPANERFNIPGVKSNIRFNENGYCLSIFNDKSPGTVIDRTYTVPNTNWRNSILFSKNTSNRMFMKRIRFFLRLVLKFENVRDKEGLYKVMDRAISIHRQMRGENDDK